VPVLPYSLYSRCNRELLVGDGSEYGITGTKFALSTSKRVRIAAISGKLARYS